MVVDRQRAGRAQRRGRDPRRLPGQGRGALPRGQLPRRPQGQTATADFTDTGTTKPTDLKKLDGRFTSTGADGVRELPGFRSVGEMMMAYYSNPTGTPPTPPDYASIDDLGRRSSQNHKVGVDIVLYDATKTATGATYAQRLAIANGSFNMVSTRSDLFGVWFVIQGYQRSDVENLGPEDPMIPSVQRRFFMVVDRSEVVRKGQKPRIVLLREVPMF